MISKNISIGLLAHVDAGKTTLSESILLDTGAIRRAGRVDHGDSFLDTEKEERERGITIFSKQALFKLGEKQFTLIDTPGHVDFSAEMERALSVLDYAVLIISAPDGIHGHDITLWRLFKSYKLPVFIFVNKMDQTGTDKEKVLGELKKRFGDGVMEPDDSEELALLDEELTEKYLQTGIIEDADIIGLIRERRLFPVCFGSALKNEGVAELLKHLDRFTEMKAYPETFGARVYKISRDSRGRRIAHIKITGGTLHPKETVLVFSSRTGKTPVSEKAEQLLLYNGQSAVQLNEACAGMAVAVTGLTQAEAGGFLGAEAGANERLMVPLFNSKITSTFDIDMHKLYLKLKELEEEIPEIELSFDSSKEEINARLMGEVQTEILKALVKERFNVDIDFSDGSVVYKETVTGPVIGGGHYEPLKHYAEAHILIEPLERGSGIEIVSNVKDEVLAGNFQRLIMTHLEERKHCGVLTGAELTDVRFTVISGRAHEKHTEGGDFRESVYRAVRQGLMKARLKNQCKILEPYYSFELTVPAEMTGRAMTDLSQLAEAFEGPELNAEGDEAVFTGRAAVSRLRGYDKKVLSYTGGFGRLSLSFGGYGDCADEERVISEAGYNPELDTDNPTGSVFCSHGAGFYVPWNEVDEMLHIDIKEEERHFIADSPGEGLRDNSRGSEYADTLSIKAGSRGGSDAEAGTKERKKYDYLGAGLAGDRELESIWSSASGRNINVKKAEEKKRLQLMREASQAKGRADKGNAADTEITTAAPSVKIPDPKEQVLLVDGYNIIFAWEELNELSKINIDSARTVLADMLSNYQGYRGMNLILVFDAYKVRNGQGSVEKYHNIHIVYTREAQTADAYIEKTVHESGKRLNITVATNDGMEQIIAFGGGANRMSARELYGEVIKCNSDIYEKYLKKPVKLKNRIELQEANT